MTAAAEAPPRAQLLCRTGELAGQTHELTRSNVIGRNSENDVVLHSSLISGRHARIWEKDGSFFVEDLGSSNGTWVDGIRVTDPVRLDRLNVITFAGAFDFVFALPEIERRAPEETPARAAAEPESPPAETPTVELEAERAAGDASSADRTAPAESAPAAEGTSTGEDAQRTRLDMDFQPLPDLEGDQESEPAATGGDAPGAEGADAPAAPEAGAADDDAGRTRVDMDFQPLPDLEDEERAPPDDDAGRTRVDMDFQPLPDLEGDQASEPPTAESAPRPRYRLEASLPDGGRQAFDVETGSYTLGRSPDCDITLNEPSISRHHATLTVGETLVLEDADSVNGTFVNDSEVDRAELAPNSTFSLGPFVEIKVTQR